MAEKVLVVGGNGFLGSAICRRLIQAGQSVVSLSRRGEPPQLSRLTHWAQQVQWEKGNALDVSSYKDLLAQCKCVVHCVGQISELPYKNFFNDHSVETEQRSFERVNRDTAIFLASAASSHSCVESMIFISAAHVPFPLSSFVDSRYTASKRSAEQAVLGCSSFRSVVLRPGLMFGDARPWSLGVAAALSVTTQLPLCAKHISKKIPSEAAQLFRDTLQGNSIGRFMNGFKAATKGIGGDMYDPEGIDGSFVDPLRTETVAEATAQAIMDPTVSGVKNIENIRSLSATFGRR